MTSNADQIPRGARTVEDTDFPGSSYLRHLGIRATPQLQHAQHPMRLSWHTGTKDSTSAQANLNSKFPILSYNRFIYHFIYYIDILYK